VYRQLLTIAMQLLVLVPVSWAGVIEVIEPDDYPAGTDISTVFPGVTLSTVNSDLGDPRVFALEPDEPNWASTGELVFGHSGDYAVHWVMDTIPTFRYGALRADFSPAALSFSVDIIGNDSLDYGQLDAYDAAGNLLVSLQTGALSAGDVETLNVSDVGDISYVIAGGLLADTVCLDNMRFVPEPETALLGVLGIIVLRRRRTS
jgi:hypothetical protein